MIEDLIDFEMEHFSLALGFDLIIRGKASKFFFCSTGISRFDCFSSGNCELFLIEVSISLLGGRFSPKS